MTSKASSMAGDSGVREFFDHGDANAPRLDVNLAGNGVSPASAVATHSCANAVDPMETSERSSVDGGVTPVDFGLDACYERAARPGLFEGFDSSTSGSSFSSDFYWFGMTVPTGADTLDGDGSCPGLSNVSALATDSIGLHAGPGRPTDYGLLWVPYPVQTKTYIIPQEYAVHFGTVTVREFSHVLGDNPACSKGPSLSLGWDFIEYEPVRIDDFELLRTRRTSLKDLMLNRDRRERILRNLHYSEIEITEAVRRKNKIRRQRRRTV